MYGVFRVEDKIVDFECGTLDVPCKAMESLATWLAELVAWLATLALGGDDVAPGTSLWKASMNEAGTWLGLSILVMMISFTIGVTVGTLSGNPAAVKRAFIGTAISVPSFFFAYFFIGEGLEIIDDISEGILERFAGVDGFGNVFSTLFKGNNFLLDSVTSGGTGVPILQLVLVAILFAFSLFLIMVAMAFRTFVLMVLLAFGPLAFMMMPATGVRDEMVKKWLSAVLAMALAKPLILATIAMVLAALGDVESVVSAEGLTLGIGLIIAAFMPMLAYGFFNFIGANRGSDDVGQRAGQMTAQKTQQTVSVAGRMKPNGGGGGARAGGAAAGAAGAATATAAAGKRAAEQGQAQASPQSGAAERPGQGPAASGRLPRTDAGAPSGPKPPPTDTTPPPRASTPPSRPSNTAGGGRPAPTTPPSETKPSPQPKRDSA